MSATFEDGVFTTAAVNGPQRFFPAFPDADTSSLLIEQDFIQYLANYVPQALNSAGPTLSSVASYLVHESQIQHVGGGLGKWTKTWAQKPAQRVEYESYSWLVPGYDTGGINARINLTHTGSVTTGILTLTNTSAHGYIVGDRVAITYTATVNKLYEISRTIIRTILTVPTTTTFTVATFQDVSTSPYYLWTQKLSGSRDPITYTVNSKLVYDYFRIAASGGDYTSADLIPVVDKYYIEDEYSKETQTLSVVSNPSIASYQFLISGSSHVVAEASHLSRWMGQIYQRVTRYVRAQ
ncbi:MAG: hypothetical protein JWM68_2526 [Verrucomicrobiales bacterium]|nr:hypothetical protein [Verrucomicrobiales bacterium]